MSLFVNNYSALITNGLGGAATQSLITTHFGLNISITIVVKHIQEPGGGSASNGGFYVPLQTGKHKKQKIVTITIIFSEDIKWKKSYLVDITNADKIVQIVNFVNSAKSNLLVGVGHVTTVFRKVVATITNDK